MKKQWFELKAQANQPAEMTIYDDIGAFGVSAKDFIAALSGITAPVIHLNINSPGGSVFDALAMYNALRQHPADILVNVVGVAASAASLIAMAGDKIVMPANAFMMIHNPWSTTSGNAAELRDMADVMDKITASLVGIYSARSGQSADKVHELLDAETWLNADEALALGFTDEISNALPIVARFDVDRMPEAIRAAWGNSRATPATPALSEKPSDSLTRVKAFEGVLIDFAKSKGLALSPKVLIEPNEYLLNVTALFEAAHLSELVDTAIEAKLPLSVLRSMVQNFKVSTDVQINSHIPPTGGGLASQVWNNRRGGA